MRSRRSLSGPLLLVVLGVALLLNTISPNFHVLDVFANTWPYLLIGWGLIQAVEVFLQWQRPAGIPIRTMSGGSWVLVILIILVGQGSRQAQRMRPWWQHGGWVRGIEAFGREHQFSVDAVEKPLNGRTPRLVIETFRGDAKITAGTKDAVVVTGRKMIRAFEDSEATRVDKMTPVEVIRNGDVVIVRCHQDTSGINARVATDLEISVPPNTAVEATGTLGDFDVSGLNGNVDISSENAGVRLENLGGNVKVETRNSDLIRCVNLRGGLDLRGHGEDLELNRIGGEVRINGDYRGSVSLRELSHPVRMENLRTECDLRQVGGELRMEHGNLSMQDVVGPVKLNTRATDVRLQTFSGDVDLAVDRGDVQLRPGHLPLNAISVSSRGGNIEIELPSDAAFALNAKTGRGEIVNNFGGSLEIQTAGHGSRVEGVVGGAGPKPTLRLQTEHGTITLQRASAPSSEVKASL